MDPSPHILVAHKKSRYETLVIEGEDARLAELVEAGHLSVRSLERAHQAHQASLEAVCGYLSKQGFDYDCVFRGDVTSTEGYDLVVTVGGDGTVLDLSHRIAEAPLLGINSDPKTSVGYFCAGPAAGFPALLERTLEHQWEPFALRRFSVTINDEIFSLPALNDILVSHTNPAAVSNYLLCLDDSEPEEQKSSGIWIATAAGSTAAIRSAGGYVLPLDSADLQYVVREPYPLRGHAYRHLKGIRPMQADFRIISKMTSGSVFLDGPHITYPFNLGDELHVDASAPPLVIYGLNERRRTG